MSASIGIYPGGPTPVRAGTVSGAAAIGVRLSIQEIEARRTDQAVARDEQRRLVRMAAGTVIALACALVLGWALGKAAGTDEANTSLNVGGANATVPMKGDRLDRERERIIRELWRMELVGRGL